MVVGTRFHEFAFRFYDWISTIPVDEWDICIPDEFCDIEQDMAGWFVEQEQLRYKYVLRNGGTIEDFMPIMREIVMRNEQLVIESTMDRVDWAIRNCTTVCPVEYKTGNKVNADKILEELAFYGILFETTQGLTVTEYRIINPKLKYNEVFPVNDRLIKKVLKQIIKLRQALNEDNFPPRCTDTKFAACKVCTPDEAFPGETTLSQMANQILHYLEERDTACPKEE